MFPDRLNKSFTLFLYDITEVNFFSVFHLHSLTILVTLSYEFGFHFSKTQKMNAAK